MGLNGSGLIVWQKKSAQMMNDFYRHYTRVQWSNKLRMTQAMTTMTTKISCWSLSQSLANRSWSPLIWPFTQFVPTHLVVVQPLFILMPLNSVNSLSIIQSLMMHICRNTTCCLLKSTFHFLIEGTNEWMAQYSKYQSLKNSQPTVQ